MDRDGSKEDKDNLQSDVIHREKSRDKRSRSRERYHSSTSLSSSSSSRRKAAYNAVKELGITITVSTTLEEFKKNLPDSIQNQFTPEELEEFFEEIISKMKHDMKKQERKLRRKMDDFKSVLKKLDGIKITMETSWDHDILPILKERKLDEFEGLSEKDAKYVFDKMIKKLKV